MPTQLYMGSGDLNSSPHAFEASVVSTETSLKPSVLIFIRIHS